MDALTFLGTGCGWPMADRFHTSLLLEADGRRWLLDAGEPCSHRLKAMGVPFSSIDALFISHGHSDHLSGLPMFIQGSWLEGRDRPLPVFAPAELIAPIQAWLDVVYLPAKILGFPIEYHAWEELPGRAVTLDQGKFHAKATPTTHLDGLRGLIEPDARDRFLAYSLSFDWPKSGRRFVFSADLGRPEDLDAALTAPCDLLVCELAHFTPERLFSYLREKQIRRLCLTHLSPELASAGAEISALAVASLPQVEAVRVVTDGKRIEFQAFPNARIRV